MVCIYWQCLIHDWALNINYPEKSQDSSLTAQEFHCSKYIWTFLWLLMSVVAIVCISCDGHQTASFTYVIGLIFSRVNGTLKLQRQTNYCHTFVHQSVQSVMVCKWISGSISDLCWKTYCQCYIFPYPFSFLMLRHMQLVSNAVAETVWSVPQIQHHLL